MQYCLQLFEFQTTINNNQQIKIKNRIKNSHQLNKYIQKIPKSQDESMHPYIFYSQQKNFVQNPLPHLETNSWRGAVGRFRSGFGPAEDFFWTQISPGGLDPNFFPLTKTYPRLKNLKELESNGFFLDFLLFGRFGLGIQMDGGRLGTLRGR